MSETKTNLDDLEELRTLMFQGDLDGIRGKHLAAIADALEELKKRRGTKEMTQVIVEKAQLFENLTTTAGDIWRHGYDAGPAAHKAENERLREALAEYSNKDNWLCDECEAGHCVNHQLRTWGVRNEIGPDIAREALANIGIDEKPQNQVE